ncbi:hypothetical protein Fmac_010349 [Flemingia macrophylla]|uniref:UBX domain-containing protein n=1 Tax=Flemingia macrophylla TaxID=520843 RepID=A0ABD1MJC6_9FABA
MATPNAVAEFMLITGAPESVAVQKLVEHRGNLNDAIHHHFLQADRHILSGQGQNLAAAPLYHNAAPINQNLGISTFVNAVRTFRPSLLLDANYRRELRDLFRSRPPSLSSHPPEVRAWGPHYQSRLNTTGADMAGNYQNEYPLAQSNTSHDPDAEIDEAMLQAAIEASKMEGRGGSSREQADVLNVSSDGGLPQSHFQQEDDDLAHAISLSLETAELEKAIREHLVVEEKEGLEAHDLLDKGKKTNSHISQLEEMGKMLDKKEVRLSKEPPLCNEVITIVVRMPDGCRIKRRFLKTDKLEHLFDFIDTVRFQGKKPGTYRLVKSYPRCYYSINNCSSTFSEVGLSNDETLFLEWTEPQN